MTHPLVTRSNDDRNRVVVGRLISFDGNAGKWMLDGKPPPAGMKLLVADAQRQMKETAARGEKVAVWGPSPGFRELRWLKPVLAGDTIAFASEIVDKRTSESRPNWGILQARQTGINQHGELVYSVLSTAFVPRRETSS